MSQENSLKIEFKQNLKNFVPEIFSRILYLITCTIIYAYVPEMFADKSLFIAGLFIFFNVAIFILTLYGTSRRKTTILNYINMRIKTHKDYSSSEIQYKSNFLNSPFYVFLVFSSMLFGASIFIVFWFLGFKDPGSFLYPIVALLVPFCYALILRAFRMNFISNEIESVTYNGHKLNKTELSDFVDFMYNQNTKNDVYYLNDNVLFELEEKANVFKLRVETLLIEAVFIGALAFGTFIQLTSPESITSFESIDEDSKTLGMENRDFVQEKKIKYKQMVYEFIYGKDTSLNNSEKNLLLEKISESKVFDNVLMHGQNGDTTTSKKSMRMGNIGFFNNWALERQYTIFSFFYKQFNKKRNENGLFDIIDLGIIGDKSQYEESTLKFSMDEKTKILVNVRDSLSKTIPVDTSKIDDKINKQINIIDSICRKHSNILYELIKIKDQITLKNLCSNKTPYEDDSLETRKEVLKILNFHDTKKFVKYHNITKKIWDEQEYLFLIAMGSIICSVLYISVLISRFPIIIKIENLFAELKKASTWNNREEDTLANVVRAEIEMTNSIILEKLKSKREFYTEKLQIQLSKCELLSCKIETNIQVISFIRNIGLYLFFIVLLISTMMIDPRFTFILSSILIYAIVGSSFMQEGSSIRKVWKSISGSNKSDDYSNTFD